jgi:predicted glycosyltransferase
MKIMIYCQHVLGVGHLFRTIEICKALADHDIILVTGGPRVVKKLPGHVREVRLPELQMDPHFRGLLSTDPHATLDRIKEERQVRLFALFKKEAPDLLLIELYPFGRKAFRFELDPLLEGIKKRRLPACRVVCSVRDILVEKEKQEKHELRAVLILNDYFDTVLVHSDPNLVRIEETFLQIDEIEIPMVYTGFIAPKPASPCRTTVRQQLGIGADDNLIIASAGSGSVGSPLLESVIMAFNQLGIDPSRKKMRVYTGPMMPKSDVDHLKGLAGQKIVIKDFTSDFLSYLSAADLSISMAGYNTSMNILAAKVPALVWPFSENQEQRLRAERLAGIGALRVLDDEDIHPETMAAIITQTLTSPPRVTADVNLEGAENTAKWLESFSRSKRDK